MAGLSHLAGGGLVAGHTFFSYRGVVVGLFALFSLLRVMSLIFFCGARSPKWN